jgi:diguanylate cyclase (GGDEF)-like protein/PAS domain S-box-containing protein
MPLWSATAQTPAALAPEPRLHALMALAMQVLGAQGVAVYAVENGGLRLVSSQGTPTFPAVLASGEAPPGEVLTSGAGVVRNQLWLGHVGTLAAPVREGGALSGVLVVCLEAMNATPAALPILEALGALLPEETGAAPSSDLPSSHTSSNTAPSSAADPARLRLFELALDAADAVLITEVGRDGAELPAQDWRIVYANHAFGALTGHDAARLIGQNPNLLRGAETDSDTLNALKRKNGQLRDLEVLETRADGTGLWVELSVVSLSDATGVVTHRVSKRRDITAARRTLLLESDRNHVLELLVAGAKLPETLSALSKLLRNQYPDAEPVMLLCEDGELRLAYAEHADADMRAALSALKLEFGNGSAAFAVWQGVPVVTEDVRSDPVWARLSRFAWRRGVTSAWATPIMQNDADSPLGAIELLFKDRRRASPSDLQRLSAIAKLAAAVIERTQLAERLERQSTRDALTGLPNRFALELSLERSLLDAKTKGTRLALLQINLDGFRQFNDTLGHAVGDELLVAVAQRWAPLLPSKDFLARMGGDEFGLVVHHLEDPSEAGTLARSLLEAIRQPFELRGVEVFLGASIGYAAYPEDGTDAHTLIRHANTAMNVVKRHGKNDAQRFRTQMNTAARERLELEVALRRALERDELEVYYQTQVNNAGAVVSLEALTYWNHPTQGVVSPSRFIPIAEESGLIVPLGAWVLAKSCSQVQQWRREGINVSLAVNMNVQQFLRSDFADSVAKTLQRTGLEARHLELELTESALMHDLGLAVERLLALRRLGVKVSIDDFGTGYSSLSYLQKLPVNAVKIDRSFVSHLEPNAPGWNMVNLIVMLARHLRLGVVAEGVETPAQFEALRDLAVDRSQGYLFSRPTPAPELIARLRNGTAFTN